MGTPAACTRSAAADECHAHPGTPAISKESFFFKKHSASVQAAMALPCGRNRQSLSGCALQVDVSYRSQVWVIETLHKLNDCGPVGKCTSKLIHTCSYQSP